MDFMSRPVARASKRQCGEEYTHHGHTRGREPSTDSLAHARHVFYLDEETSKLCTCYERPHTQETTKFLFPLSCVSF